MDEPDDDRYARAPEPEDVVRICRALNQADARYLLIGGFAVVAHGAGRFTEDIDLLIDDAPANVARVRQALSVLAADAAPPSPLLPLGGREGKTPHSRACSQPVASASLSRGGGSCVASFCSCA